MTTPEKILRLPTWAQEHIANLERGNDELRLEVKRATTGDDCDERNVWAELPAPSHRGGLPAYAPTHLYEAKFKIGPRKTVDFVSVRMLRDKHGPPTLVVNGFDTLIVRPRASNAFEVAVDPAVLARRGS